MHIYDVTLLTDRRYVSPEKLSDYISNVLLEDRLVAEALETLGLRVHRTNWDNEDFDWSSTRYALFRTTWDYFDRIGEFKAWFERTRHFTHFINPAEMLLENMDKHYLLRLRSAGIPIPPTIFLEPGESASLCQVFAQSGWGEAILKPAISGAARHTYRITAESAADREAVYRRLIQNESMLLQEFLPSVLDQGEVAVMLFGGTYSHAILKRAKPGDFRVQDDFGGTVHPHTPSEAAIALAESAVATCSPRPVYARVDLITGTDGQFCVSELELIEPELWMRIHEPAAAHFAAALLEYIS